VSRAPAFHNAAFWCGHLIRTLAIIEHMFEDVVRGIGSVALSPAGRKVDELLAGIAEAQRAINMLTAAQLDLVAEFARRRPAPDLPAPPGG
jgi:hypothetical protein